jgi:CO/xanthine dehydrogenase Mo-binding subunit
LISPFIGGGFGSKLWVNADAILAAIAARQLNRPVKTTLTRQQVFHVTTHRSDTIQRIRPGTDRNGRILAIGHDVFSGNLWSEQTYEGAALQTRTLYAGDNRLTALVHTTPPDGPGTRRERPSSPTSTMDRIDVRTFSDRSTAHPYSSSCSLWRVANQGKKWP